MNVSMSMRLVWSNANIPMPFLIERVEAENCRHFVCAFQHNALRQTTHRSRAYCSFQPSNSINLTRYKFTIFPLLKPIRALKSTSQLDQIWGATKLIDESRQVWFCALLWVLGCGPPPSKAVKGQVVSGNWPLIKRSCMRAAFLQFLDQQIAKLVQLKWLWPCIYFIPFV